MTAHPSVPRLIVGAKLPLRPMHVWAIRVRLQMARRVRDLALFDIALDSKLRGCDVVSLTLADIMVSGSPKRRATVIQQKTGRPVQFEITEQNRRSLMAWLGRHNPLGAVAVVVLLALTAVTVWTGAFGGEAAEELHEVIAWVLLAMIALHVVAVIIMSLLERENLVRAMVSGDKTASRHLGAVDARSPSTVAWLLAAIVVGSTSYLIVNYDRAAFTLRSAESFEHRADASRGATEAEHDEPDED